MMSNYLLLRLAFLDFLERVRRLPPACGMEGLPGVGAAPAAGAPAPGAPAPASRGFGLGLGLGLDIIPPIYLTIQ